MDEVFTVIDPVDDSDGNKLVISDKGSGKGNKKATLKWVLIGLSVIALVGCVVAVVVTQTESAEDEPLGDAYDTSLSQPCAVCNETGKLAGNPGNCSTYYICSNENWIEMPCGDLCWDINTGNCNWCSENKCQGPCDEVTVLPETTAQPERNPHPAYNNKPERNPHPAYNRHRDLLQPPQMRRKGDISPMAPCKNASCVQGTFAGNPDNCTTYYFCDAGNSWVEMICNDKLCWDIDSDTCNWCTEATCQGACDVTTTTPVLPTTTTPTTTPTPVPTTTTTTTPTTTLTSPPVTSPPSTTPAATPSTTTEPPTSPPTTTVTVTPTASPPSTTAVTPTSPPTSTPTPTTSPPPSTTSTPASTTSTGTPVSTEPSDPRGNPWYEIRLWGNFSTLEGEDITPECSNEYLQAVTEKATAMIAVVNNLLDTGSLCSGFNPGDFWVVTVATVIFPTGSTGQTNIDYLMRLDMNLRIDDVHDCTHDVSVYLQAHSNWDTPIIPEISGCPSVEFETDRFNDVGSGWFCFDRPTVKTSGYPESPAQPLGYDIHLRSHFDTLDDVNLTAQCAVTYNDEWQRLVMEQTYETNDLLGLEICNAVEMTIIAGVPSFTYVGTVGHIDVTFILRIGDEHSFMEALYCVDELIEYLLPHESWRTPLLPPEVGCPFLVFEGQYFTEEGQLWICKL